MKLSFTLFLTWLITANACRTPVRKPGVQGDNSRQANPDAVKRARHNNEIDSVILPAWSSFVLSVKERNFQELKRKSMDSIHTCDSVYATSHFLTKCFHGIFDSTLLSKITDSTAIEFTNRTETWSSFTPAVQKMSNATDDDAITLKEIVITKVAEQPDGPWMITIDFIPTHKGYLFYRCNSYGGPVCCK
jgi:hypothetical protein